MIKAVVKFWGTQQGQYGMPDPYHSYLVVSSPWQTSGSGIATILPLTTDAPLTQKHVPVLQGGERGAFDDAIAALKREPKNAGLTSAVDED